MLIDNFIYAYESVISNDATDLEHLMLNVNKENYIKKKILDFAELLLPKFTDIEFKSHFRLNRSSIQVNILYFTFETLIVVK